MSIRRKLVAVDNERTAFFVDSMANAEVVKLFGNEEHEVRIEGNEGNPVWKQRSDKKETEQTA